MFAVKVKVENIAVRVWVCCFLKLSAGISKCKQQFMALIERRINTFGLIARRPIDQQKRVITLHIGKWSGKHWPIHFQRRLCKHNIISSLCVVFYFPLLSVASVVQSPMPLTARECCGSKSHAINEMGKVSGKRKKRKQNAHTQHN